MSQSFIPKVHYGKIERHEIVSQFITQRNVDVWLPDGYSSNKKYAVLYMHDGQMLFDETQTWNKKAWHVDSVASSLMKKKGMQSFIVVAIWNDPQTRHADYFPQKPFESLTQIQKETVTAQLNQAGRVQEAFYPNSDNYLKYLVTELKPFIDKNYSVYTDPLHTFIAGSSMGGLISLYAVCEYPNVFGGATCLSTHWPGTFTLDNNPVPETFLNYLKKSLHDPKHHKLYFDCGDQTLDAMYPPLQKRVDEIMNQKGYMSENFLSKYFKGEAHDENAWSKRLDIPLRFIFTDKLK